MGRYGNGPSRGYDEGGRRGGRGGGRPPHLRGRDIGMYFARKGQAKRKELNARLRPRILLDDRLKCELERGIDEYCHRNGLEIGEIPDANLQDRDNEVKDEAEDTDTEETSETLATSSSQESIAEIDEGENLKSMDNNTSKNQNASSSLNEAIANMNNDENLILQEVIFDEHFIPITTGSEFSHESIKLDPNLEITLKNEWNSNCKSSQYLKMLTNRERLPTLQMAGHILDEITKNQVTVISGETGCGKSTQVPQILLDDSIAKGFASKTYIVVTQPRRISATSLAIRVAQERNEKLGESVGYQIRLEARKPRQNGSILYCTNGILLRWLLWDKGLCAVSHLVLDEIHERDLFSDFLLIIIRNILQIRKDIKVVLMSATLNARHFSRYFNNCPMIEIPGRQFPVKSYFLEDVLQMTSYSPPETTARRRIWCPEHLMHLPPAERRVAQTQYLIEYGQQIDMLVGMYDHNVIHTLRELNEDKMDFELIVELVLHITNRHNNPEEAILIFLPGWQDIKNLLRTFETFGGRFNDCKQFSFVPIHSLLPSVDQHKVFDRPIIGCRKVVLATNIAETSITIEDVVHVIDCGKIKTSNFDAECNLQTLKAEWVSQANAKQRRGRAGRMRDGFCYHLFLKSRFETLSPYMPPEMQRTRLDSLCLQIKLMGLGRVEDFVSRAPDPPSQLHLRCALTELVGIGAIASMEDDTLTPLGYHLARIPAAPHCAKMIILSSLFSCVDPVLTVACSLDYKDPFHVPFGQESKLDEIKRSKGGSWKSDHLFWISLYKEYLSVLNTEVIIGAYAANCFARKFYLNQTTIRLVERMKKQFCQYLVQAGFLTESNHLAANANLNSNDMKLVRAIVGAALYPRVCESIPKLNLNSRGFLKFDSGGRWTRKVEIHPKSANAEIKEVESRYVSYHQAVRSSKIYMNDCGMVSPMTLALFARPIALSQDLLVINCWIQFYIDKDCAQIVYKTNTVINDILMQLFDKPAVINWNNSDSTQMKMLHLIKHLIDNEMIDSSDHASSDRGASAYRRPAYEGRGRNYRSGFRRRRY